jgi:hypothetical protein
MTMTLEDRLRDVYQAVARTVRPETISPGLRYHRPAPGRLRGRFSMFAPFTAAAAVVVAVGAALAIPHLIAGPGHDLSSTVTTPAATGTPPFMVEVGGAADHQLIVQLAGTRHISASLPPPNGSVYWAAVAAVTDRTFIVATSTYNGPQTSSALYRLKLSANGKPSQLTRLSSGIPGQVTALAVSQDGTTIAYTTVGSSNTQSTLCVITGASTRSWTVPVIDGPGATGLMPDSLSLSGDASELSFIILTAADTAGPIRATGTVWLLPVDSAPGSATARGHKVTAGPAGTVPLGTVLSADGQTVYDLSVADGMPGTAHSSTESATLSAYRGLDGTLLSTIHAWTNIRETSDGLLAMTRVGSQLLVWGMAGTTAALVDPATGATQAVQAYCLQGNRLSGGRVDIAW